MTDDFGNTIELFPNYGSNIWHQFIGFQCGEYQFFTESFFPVWSEQYA